MYTYRLLITSLVMWDLDQDVFNSSYRNRQVYFGYNLNKEWYRIFRVWQVYVFSCPAPIVQSHADYTIISYREYRDLKYVGQFNRLTLSDCNLEPYRQLCPC